MSEMNEMQVLAAVKESLETRKPIPHEAARVLAYFWTHSYAPGRDAMELFAHDLPVERSAVAAEVAALVPLYQQRGADKGARAEIEALDLYFRSMA